MTVLPCGSDSDAQAIRTWVSQYTSHPNQFIYSDRAFVSTFSGETCTFGAGSTAEGWHSQFVGHPDLADKLFFVPSFFIDPATFSTFQDVMHGDFNVRPQYSAPTGRNPDNSDSGMVVGPSS